MQLGSSPTDVYFTGVILKHPRFLPVLEPPRHWRGSSVSGTISGTSIGNATESEGEGKMLRLGNLNRWCCVFHSSYFFVRG